MTSSTLIEWLFVLVFFLAFFLISIAEIFWLRRKVGIDLKRALIFVLSSNFITITVGFFGSFVIFAVLLMLAFGGSLQEMPAGDAGIWALVAVMALFPVALMVLWKRLLFKILKITSDDNPIRPWPYSLIASILFFLVVIGLPVAFFYIASKII